MTIESPCIDVCQMSEDKTLCTGCFRSLSEIANWSQFTDSEKIQVIAAARERRAAWEAGDLVAEAVAAMTLAQKVRTSPAGGISSYSESTSAAQGSSEG
jgi:uncharacterized protein